MSLYLKNKFNKNPKLFEIWSNESILRLACQHSPMTWLGWTRKDHEIHRSRMILRIMFELICTNVKPPEQFNLANRHKFRNLLNPIKDERLQSYLETSTINFEEIFPMLYDLSFQTLMELSNLKHIELLSKDRFKELYFEMLNQIWSIIPSVLALQQLIQPLLEVLILADHVFYLKESTNHNYLAGYIRLFDPSISPRCMALIASKIYSSDII